MIEEKDSGYPYTYACDYIRSLAGYNKEGTKLSRSDASQIRSKIAEIIGMEDEELAESLADAEMAKTDEERGREVRIAMRSMGLLPEDTKI